MAVGAGALAGTGVLAGVGCESTKGAAGAATLAAPKRSLRVAHLTDVHVQPERNAEAGMSACLAHAQERRPDLIITGGDAVMDVFGQPQPRADLLRGVWQGRLKQDCSVPTLHTCGNHDIFGWNRKDSKTTGAEADWGKRYACELFGIPKTYHSCDRGGWRIIVLDSTQPSGGGYVAYCDAEQLEWLEKTLAATPKTTPIVVVSHIPILSLCALTYWGPRKPETIGTDTAIPAGEMHTDGVMLHDLFRKHGGVKLCLSGHVHLFDRCTLDGITYICDGAVCGSWWKGDCQGVPAGYGVVDFFQDGTFTHEYVDYGWKAQG